MVIIRFPDDQTEVRALGYLAGRFSGKSWSNGDTMVPEAALPHLAAEGFSFTVMGRATYEQRIPSIRAASPAEVQ
jgi:hypothetical protein